MIVLEAERTHNPVSHFNSITITSSTKEIQSRSQWSRGLKAWTVFGRSTAGIVGSNPTPDVDVCVHLSFVCVVLCVGSGLATGWSPVQGVLPTVDYEPEKRPRSTRVVEP
jgi:hypothetical protein